MGAPLSARERAEAISPETELCPEARRLVMRYEVTVDAAVRAIQGAVDVLGPAPPDSPPGAARGRLRAALSELGEGDGTA